MKTLKAFMIENKDFLANPVTRNAWNMVKTRENITRASALAKGASSPKFADKYRAAQDKLTRKLVDMDKKGRSPTHVWEGELMEASDHSKLHDALNSLGLRHTKAMAKDSKRGYLKRGYYDGDFPNAHYTMAHAESHEFEGPQSKRKDVQKAIVGVGFKPDGERTYKGRKTRYYSKGKKHFVHIETHGDRPMVIRHRFEKTKPTGKVVYGQVCAGSSEGEWYDLHKPKSVSEACMYDTRKSLRKRSTLNKINK